MSGVMVSLHRIGDQRLLKKCFCIFDRLANSPHVHASLSSILINISIFIHFSFRTIVSVLGLIEPSELGRTYTHEHLSLDYTAVKYPPTGKHAHHDTLPLTLENLGWIRRNPWVKIPHDLCFEIICTKWFAMIMCHWWNRYFSATFGYKSVISIIMDQYVVQKTRNAK